MGDPAVPFGQSAPITGAELAELGDSGRCELIDGKIVRMSPTGAEHGILEAKLASVLRAFVTGRGLGTVLVGETGVYTRRNPDRVRGMDVAFVSSDRMPDRPQGFLEVAPDLVVEIISPNDRWEDTRQKVAEYFEIGVQRVWIVEPKNRKVLVYRSESEVATLDETDTLPGEGRLTGFKLPISELFAD